MKKFILGVLCCIGLLTLTVGNGDYLALKDKPEITSINLYV
ncbi:hypothetical protein PGC35_09470 [Psychrobacillus sp. PGGUH221]